MQLDPKISMGLNILALVLSVFAMAGWWSDLLGPKTAATVTGVMTTLVSAMNVILHAYTPPTAGPAVPAPTVAVPPSPVAVVKMLALALVPALLLGLMSGAAQAQTRPRLTGDPIRDIKNAVSGGAESASSGAADQIGQALMKPFEDLAKFIGDDVDGAIALSTQIPEAQDGHGQQCLMALKTFGTIFKAHPKPLSFHIATDLEALRLFQISANNLCSNVHCTQVFGDFANTIQTAAPANISIPIPSLHDLCAKVPQIALIPPIPVPASTAPTSPASTTSTPPASTPAPAVAPQP